MHGIIGVIDGTHMRLLPYKLLDSAQWPGSVQETQILRETGLLALFEAGRVPAVCHLFGDSGYPSQRWLLTPRVPSARTTSKLQQVSVYYT